MDSLINNLMGVWVVPALDPVRVREEPNEATYQVHLLPSCNCKMSCLQLVYRHAWLGIV